MPVLEGPDCVFNTRLASSDEGHDFDFIAGLEQAGSVARARNQFEISLDGQKPGLHGENIEQPGDGGAGLDLARLAIDANLHGVTHFYEGLSDSVEVRDEGIKEKGSPAAIVFRGRFDMSQP